MRAAAAAARVQWIFGALPECRFREAVNLVGCPVGKVAEDELLVLRFEMKVPRRRLPQQPRCTAVSRVTLCF